MQAVTDDQSGHEQRREGAAQEDDLAERQPHADQLQHRVIDQEDEIARDDRRDADQVLAESRGIGGVAHDGRTDRRLR
jgi:hypothetical protein